MNNLWTSIHKDNYATTDWIDKPSIFAETAITYFPKTGKVLDLGAGQGQDSRFFAEHGYDVTSTDLEQTALDLSKAKLTGKLADKVTLQQVDLREELPFENDTFDVVYAHLSLHYFDSETTRRIVDQVRRVLKPGGVFAFFVNATTDPEYGTGTELEPDYFQIDGMAKRYFSTKTARKLTKYFEVTLLDDQGETYKDSAKGIHNLIRFIGTKPAVAIGGLALPCVGAIIEREQGGEIELLIQTRWKPGSDPVYTGTIEFPIGKLETPYQNIFDALAHEVHEETGLTIRSIRGEDKTAVLTTGKDDAALGFRPFCCTQKLKNGLPWISFIFVCTVDAGQTVERLSETRDVRWVKASEIKRLFQTSPEQFFALESPAWQYYFDLQKAA